MSSSKKTVKILAFALVCCVLFAALPLSSAAYGTSDGRLVITHINTAGSYEGAAVIMAGKNGSTVGDYGGYEWWKVAVFGWDKTERVYKVTAVNNSTGSGQNKGAMQIPDGGFAYGVCVGNDYSASGGINYINAPTKNSYELVGKLKVGDKAYLYGTDLKNGIIKNNGEKWYSSSFVSESYIKIGAPAESGTAYDPDAVTVLGYTITPNVIDKIEYAVGKSILFTPNYGKYAHNSGSASFQWWSSVIFDYDPGQSCYVVASISTAANNDAAKQPLIPQNGFAIADCAKNTTAISNLGIGTKCWLYDIDLKNGRFGASPRIAVNLPEEGKTAYDPGITSRLDAPVVKEAEGGFIDSPDSGAVISWDAVPGATSYTVSINDGTNCADGALAVKPVEVTSTSYTVPAGIIKVGSRYTFRVTAKGNAAESRFNTYTLRGISAKAQNSSLRGKKIVAFGDSLTARQGYVSMLYGYIGTEVVNSGVGGDSTVNGKQRFQRDVLDLDPDIVLICFGMNDQACNISSKKPNISIDTYRENLEYFAKTLTEKNVDVVFVTPNPVCTEKGYYVGGSYNLDYGYGFMKDFCNVMREVAFKYNCGLVDVNQQCVKNEDLTKFLLAGDGIHQTVYGHTRYADLIADYLFAAYDGVDKSTVTVNCAADGKTFAQKTLVGKSGAETVIAVPQIEGYVSSDSPVETKLKDGASVTFNYVSESSLSGLGDINGDVDIDAADYILVKRHIIGNKLLTEAQVKRADINGDGEVDAADYILIKRHIIGNKLIPGVKA